MSVSLSASPFRQPLGEDPGGIADRRNGTAWHEAGFRLRVPATADRPTVACNGCGRVVSGNRSRGSTMPPPSGGSQAPPCRFGEGSRQSRARGKSVSKRHGARQITGVDCDSNLMTLFALSVNPAYCTKYAEEPNLDEILMSRSGWSYHIDCRWQELHRGLIAARIASPNNVPKEQCRCLTRMFSIASRVVPIVSLHVVYVTEVAKPLASAPSKAP